MGMGLRRDIWEWGVTRHRHPQVRYRVHVGAGSLCSPGVGDLCSAVPLAIFAPLRDMTPSSASPKKGFALLPLGTPWKYIPPPRGMYPPVRCPQRTYSAGHVCPLDGCNLQMCPPKSCPSQPRVSPRGLCSLIAHDPGHTGPLTTHVPKWLHPLTVSVTCLCMTLVICVPQPCLSPQGHILQPVLCHCVWLFAPGQAGIPGNRLGGGDNPLRDRDRVHGVPISSSLRLSGTLPCHTRCPWTRCHLWATGTGAAWPRVHLAWADPGGRGHRVKPWSEPVPDHEAVGTWRLQGTSCFGPSGHPAMSWSLWCSPHCGTGSPACRAVTQAKCP